MIFFGAALFENDLQIKAAGFGPDSTAETDSCRWPDATLLFLDKYLSISFFPLLQQLFIYLIFCIYFFFLFFLCFFL